MRIKIFLSLFLLQYAVLTGFPQKSETIDIIDVAYVPAAFPVGFSLYTHKNLQFIAYYDSAKNMTVASRKLNSHTWDYKTLDNKIGWDSHNYITLKVDAKGYIHVVGNLHASPLIYYRSSKPLDIQSLTRIPAMVGTEENRMTYPVFMDGPNGEFLFHYRHGGSGDGYEVYNIWDAKKQAWKRYLDVPLIDGKGERNAYMKGPVSGPDKHYHLIWVWRETPDCETNHTLSYARSKDLLNWESIDGKSVPLPITIDEKSLYVDPTPPGGGLFNPGIRLGFDSEGKALIGYHKYDREMNTQLFLSRYENGKWTNKQVTDWDFHWIFQGRGSIETKLSIETPKILPGRQIAFGYHRSDTGDKEIIVDEKTLEPIGERHFSYDYPGSLYQPESSFPGMRVGFASDAGNSRKSKYIYVLRWETLPANRDAKREGELPPPSLLKLYVLKKTEQ